MANKLTKLMTALGILTVATAAMAVSDTATMGVTASVVGQCSVGNTVPLSFGQLEMLTTAGPTSTASESTGGGTFDAICTYGTAAPRFKFVSANTSSNDFRLIGTNRMTYITYTLAESGNTAIAHNTPAAFTGFVSSGTVWPLRIKGSIASSEKVSKTVQEYGDTITITASFTP